MAITNNETQSNTSYNNNNQSNKAKADGYLNLKIVDRNGNAHNIPCYIPLTKDKAIHKALMSKAGEELSIIGTVNLAAAEDMVIEL